MKYKDEHILDSLVKHFKNNRLFLVGISALDLFYHKDIFNYYILTDIDTIEVYKSFDFIYKLEFEPFDYVIKINDNFIYLKIYEYNTQDNKVYLTNFYKEFKNPILIPYFYDLKNKIFYDFYSIGPMYRENLIFQKIINSDIDEKLKIYSLFYFNRYYLVKELKEEGENLLKKNIDIFKNELDKYKKILKIYFDRLNDKEIFSFIYFIIIDRINYYLLRIIDNINALVEIFPELYKLKEVYHNKENHPEGDAFEHSLRAISFIRSSDFILNYSVLFHDIGKYEVKDIKYKDKDWKFPYHSKIGVEKALNIINKWKNYLNFYENIDERLYYLIGNHMLISYIDKIDEKEQNKIIKNKDINNLVKLYKADLLSSMSELSNYKKIVSFLKNKGIKI